MKYSNLHSRTDLSSFTGLYTLFIFAPMVIEFLSKGEAGYPDET